MATKFHCDRCDSTTEKCAGTVVFLGKRAELCEGCVGALSLWFNQMRPTAFQDLPTTSTVRGR